MTSWLERALRRLRDERSGASLVLFAVILLPLVGIVGLATDVTRGYLVKSKLGDALDAAALAGAHEVLSGTNFQSDIEMFFAANFPSNFMDAEVVLAPPDVDADKEVIALSASALVPTTFLHLLGIDSFTVSSDTEVTRRTKSMDVVLSIDMSGSMGWDDGTGSSRISAARAAATSLINNLFGDDLTKELLKIGVVPWSAKVNVTLDGTVFDDTLTTTEVVSSFVNPITGASQSVVYRPDNSPVPFLAPPPANWQGCVYARYLDDASTDNDADALLGPVTTGGTDWMAWEHVGEEGEPSPDGTCDDCRACLPHGITALTASKTPLVDAIAALTSPHGTTNIAQGLAWAWRVLSPGEPFDDADPDPEGQHERIIVLLTDGQHWGSEGDGYKAAFGTGTDAGPDGMDDRLRAIADNVKADGIKIYTIQFYHDSGPLQDLMHDVATEPNAPYYHFAPDGNALATVFQEVANHLSELRLSK